jgi:hypothetical protein
MLSTTLSGFEWNSSFDGGSADSSELIDKLTLLMDY